MSDSTVWRYRPLLAKPPSQKWRSFLDNHVRDIVAIDFFVVPTATFRVLYVLLAMSHDRRRILHFNVTTSPPARWTAQQVREAFPYDTAPRLLLHDGDSIFGTGFVRPVESMGIQEVVTAPDSPWQPPPLRDSSTLPDGPLPATSRPPHGSDEVFATHRHHLRSENYRRSSIVV